MGSLSTGHFLLLLVFFAFEPFSPSLFFPSLTQEDLHEGIFSLAEKKQLLRKCAAPHGQVILDQHVRLILTLE